MRPWPGGRTQQMTAEHHWTASDGTRLFYRVDDFTDPWIDASTVVLLHPGMGSSLRLFGWVPHLARQFRVVRPDTRGHGRSEPGPLDALCHDRLSLDLFELFDHLEIASAHVMGSSAGGMIAGQAAIREPDRFRSLALYAATAGIPPSRPQKGDWMARVGKAGVRGFLEQTVRDRIGDASPEQVKWYLDSADGLTVEYLSRFVPLMASEDWTERLADFSFPVMMGVPDPDPMVERGEYERMLGYIRDCTFVTFPGASHGMTAEIPDACALEYLKFLEKVEP
jgi:3-oxoadipate enol-lactonase